MKAPHFHPGYLAQAAGLFTSMTRASITLLLRLHIYRGDENATVRLNIDFTYRR